MSDQTKAAITCSGCKGHRRFVGGRMDGHVDHLVYATPRDFPLMWEYPDGSFYERDLDGGTEAIYREPRDTGSDRA